MIQDGGDGGEPRKATAFGSVRHTDGNTRVRAVQGSLPLPNHAWLACEVPTPERGKCMIVRPHRRQPAGAGFGVVECRCLQAPGRDGQGNRRQPNTFRAHTSCMLRARALQWPDRVGVRVEHRVIVACARCAPAAGVGATAGHACAWSARQLQPACMHATPPARCMARPG